MEYTFRSFDELHLLADRQGCDVVTPDDFTLLLDLDSEEAFERFKKQFDLLFTEKGIHGCERVYGWRSKSGNRHIVVRLTQPLSIHQRIALQALLGSDLTREALSYVQEHVGALNSTVLFRPYGATIEDIVWESVPF